MGRIGARWDELESLAEELSDLVPRAGRTGLDLVGAFSHFATADCDLDFAREQASPFPLIARRPRSAGLEPRP